jgi:hypothetical protein
MGSFKSHPLCGIAPQIILKSGWLTPKPCSSPCGSKSQHRGWSYESFEENVEHEMSVAELLLCVESDCGDAFSAKSLQYKPC